MITAKIPPVMPDPGDKKKPSSSRFRRYTRTLGAQATGMAIPYIMLAYPLVGFGLGWFLMKTFNWPSWVPVVTTIMALIQAFREIYQIANRLSREEYDNGNNEQ